MFSMKKLFLAFAIVILSRSFAHAGFLSGNSSPCMQGKGLYAVKMDSTVVMVETPFSAFCLAGKYGFSDRINLYGKLGLGTIDYSTVSGAKLSTVPQLANIGAEYIMTGTTEARYSSIVTEYETVSWSVNKKSNTSTEILLGWDMIIPASNVLKTRYRLAVDNFNAGTESEEHIATTVKYSFSTEVEYSFTNNIKGSFEVGMYFGDPGGIISTFGFGLGFTSG
jgi:hypothetical protein